MKREEAIDVLKKTLAYESDFAEAKRMAIEALQAEVDCSTCKHKDKDWDSEECDSCCGNNSHYASTEVVQRGR